MTLEELKKEKEDLENLILTEVKKFNQKCNNLVNIKAIELNTARNFNLQHLYPLNIRLDFELC